ncbi:MAG: DUF2798 domain-containing protein [Bermanella sp.]
MSLFMSGIMSLVITAFNLGLVDGLVIIWFKSWVFAFCVAFPVITLLSPVVHKIVNFIVDTE